MRVCAMADDKKPAAKKRMDAGASLAGAGFDGAVQGGRLEGFGLVLWPIFMH